MCLTLETRLFDGNGETCLTIMALQETNDPYRTEDSRFLGSAGTQWAHWSLSDESQSPDQVLAVYMHVMAEQISAGRFQIAQLNHYAALPAEVEIMALAVMGAIVEDRGTGTERISHFTAGTGGGGTGAGGKSDLCHLCDLNADLAIQVEAEAVAAVAAAAVEVVEVVAAAKRI